MKNWASSLLSIMAIFTPFFKVDEKTSDFVREYSHDGISKMMKIHVMIDTERYPMVINRADEQLYRKADKEDRKR